MRRQRAEDVLRGHHGEVMATTAGSSLSASAQEAERPWRAANRPETWPCRATRACGFKNNYASRATCWQCGRDKDGRPTNAPRRTPSRSRRDSRPPPSQRAGDGNDGRGVADITEVVRCKHALQSLRRLHYAESHELVVTATRALEKAEQEERAQMSPEDVLRSSSDRLTAKQQEFEKFQKLVGDLESQLADARTKLDVAGKEVGVLQGEVARAKAALGTVPESFATMAATVAQLQQQIAAANLSVQQGTSRETVGVQLLESLVGNINILGQTFQQPAVGAAFRPPGVQQQPAPAISPGAPAPASPPGPMQQCNPAAWEDAGTY